jgi:hypothetical protein
MQTKKHTLLGVPAPSPGSAPAPTRRNTPNGRYSIVSEERAARAEKISRLLAAILLTGEPVKAADVVKWNEHTWRTLAEAAGVLSPSETTREQLIALLSDVERGRR